MFDGLLINPRTRSAIESFLAKPSHALLLRGPQGSGKLSLAKAVAAQLLSVELDHLDAFGHFLLVSRAEDKQNITIEQVRSINSALKLKIPGGSAVRRVVLIENAHLMNAEAQNALLKSLEEPSAYTVFILTANDRRRLLPTVISRMSAIEVKEVSLNESKSFFTSPESEIEAAWRLGRGLPGVISDLLDKTKDSVLKSGVDEAKKIIAMNKYERVIALDKLSSDKENFAVVLSGMARVVQALYKSAVKKNNRKQTTALLKAMRLILDSQSALDFNSSARLVALRLSLSLNI